MALSFVGTSVAMAQSGELSELAKPLLDAVMSGQYALAAALALVLAVALLRRYGSGRWPSLGSAAAGSLLVLLGGFGAALATSLSAGGALSFALAYSALKVSLYAAGGYSILKPLLSAVRGKSPPWLSRILGMFTWVFDKPNKLVDAHIAGAEAVEADPGKGTGIGFTNFE